MELTIKVNLNTNEDAHKKYRNFLINKFHQNNIKMLNCYESLKNIAPLDDSLNLKNEILEIYDKEVPRFELEQEVTVNFGYRKVYVGSYVYEMHIFISIPELNYHIHDYYSRVSLLYDLQKLQIISTEGLQLIEKKVKEIQKEIDFEEE